jgi:hydrogenase nickel incorporation protein HypA/HybF
MHELSIACSIVEKLVEFAQAHGNPRIVHVQIAVGEWSCIEPEQLRFCLESIQGHDALKELTASIETVPAMVRCAHCGYEGPPSSWEGNPSLRCPKCGGVTEMVAGHECEIQKVKFVCPARESP